MRGTASSTAYPREAGFTLVELMVTMAIAAVLLGVGLPSMTNLLRDARLSSQTDLLVGTLNRARTEALRQRQNFRVCPATAPFASSTTNCTANLQTWKTGWIAISNANVISQRVDAKSDVTVEAAFDDVTFTGTLGSAATPRTFKLCVSGRKPQQVDVTVSGNVSKRILTTTCP